MEFNFKEVERGLWGGVTLPDNVIRISGKRMGVSENIAKHWTSTAARSAADVPTVRLGYAYDPDHKAIKVWEKEGGFYCRRNEDGSGNPTSAIASLPVGLMRLGIQTGDYVLVDGETNVFKLAE